MEFLPDNEGIGERGPAYYLESYDFAAATERAAEARQDQQGPGGILE